MSKDTLITTLDFASKLPSLIRKGRSNSLIEFTKATRVEPMVLLDEKVVNLPFMPDAMQAINSIFAGYYLQAVSLMLNVGSVDVIELLDSVNPNRTPVEGGLKGLNNAYKYATESTALYGLPVPGEKVGLEHFGIEASAEPLKDVYTPGSLAAGKMIEVKVEDGVNKASFPINVRLIPVGARSSDIVQIMSLGSKDKTFMGRIHAWRSGQLEFMKDLVLCQDLISDHKKGLINDDSGMYQQSIKRKNKNFIAGLLSGNPSVATASNIVIISNHTAKELEKAVRGRLKDFKTREKIFKETYTMLLVVIDAEWEAMTVYHRSVESGSELTASDMKMVGKKDVDIGEILKAYQLGNSPSF